jgi:hypothetical protein
LLDSGQSKIEAVLSYLASAEARELDVWLQDDIRIAWLTVLHAASGVVDAWGYSFWQFFGKTYPKALLAWAERDEINRKALERCAAMVRAEKEKYDNSSQTTTRVNASTRSLSEVGPSGAVSGQPLPGVQENEPGPIRVLDGSRKSASANPVPVANLYSTATNYQPSQKCKEALCNVNGKITATMAVAAECVAQSADVTLQVGINGVNHPQRDTNANLIPRANLYSTALDFLNSPPKKPAVSVKREKRAA